MDPLSTSASIVGLVSAARTLLGLLSGYVTNVRSYPKDFMDLTQEARRLCSGLCLLESVIRLVEVNKKGVSIPAQKGLRSYASPFLLPFTF